MSILNSKKNIYVIDAGNTSIKVAKFLDDEFLEVKKIDFEDLEEHIRTQISNNDEVVLSSVLSEIQTTHIINLFKECSIIDSTVTTRMPNNYTSIGTLGTDRLCNAVFAFTRSTSDFTVVIDIGTCLKFDLVSKKDGYLGGSISPGIDLRYKSLNSYTGKLPLLSNKNRTKLVGNSTNDSIHSGILNGMEAEIIGVMKNYRKEYPNLTFFMTGGDAHYFDIDSKNDIFADENLTLKGLYEIYKQN